MTWTYSKDGGGGSTDCTNTNCDDAAFIDSFILYSYVESEPILSGDLNFDANVDVLDIVLIVGIILDTLDPTQDQQCASDVNSDGEIDVIDIVTLSLIHI